MSLATLTKTPLPALGPTGRRLEIDCPHGTTGITTANAEGGLVVTDEDSVRLALARHFAEERCRCIRKLWREYFGCPLGEIPLVRGAP